MRQTPYRPPICIHFDGQSILRRLPATLVEEACPRWYRAESHAWRLKSTGVDCEAFYLLVPPQQAADSFTCAVVVTPFSLYSSNAVSCT